ncbi:MAG TPA: hypothetical protein VFJ29_02695, partial [Candidatus Kapabacteria bacterium]|nr:hypothetical protein [Candidatus Kapabacteria bacterium]
MPEVRRATYCFAVNTKYLFVGTDVGVFRSSDSGASWSAVNNGISVTDLQLGIIAIAAEGDTLFTTMHWMGGAIGDTGVLYRSTNDGDDWTPVPGIIPPSFNGGLATYKNAVYVAAYDSAYNNRLYHSTNSGANWMLDSTAPASRITLFAATNANLYVATEFVVCRLSDNGRWIECDSGLRQPLQYTQGLSWITGFAAKGDTLFAGVNMDMYDSSYPHALLYRSTNNGVSWDTASTGLPRAQFSNSGSITAIGVINNCIFAASPPDQAGDSGTMDTVYRSTDYGVTWYAAPDKGFPINNDVGSFIVYGGKLFAGMVSNGATVADREMSGDGVFISSDSGDHWTASNNGLTNNVIPLIISSDSNLILSTLFSGIFYSTNTGSTWVRSPDQPSNGYSIHEYAQSSNKLFADIGYILYSSTDNGVTWDINDSIYINTGINTQYEPFNWNVLSMNANGDTIVIGTSGPLLYSINGGLNWIERDTNQTSVPHDVYALAVINGSIYVESKNGGMRDHIYRSTDSGTTWVLSDSGITEPYFHDLVSVGGNIVTYSDSGIFVSTNNGVSWFSTARGGVYQYLTSFAVTGSNIFAGTLYGVYLSTDKGLTWQDVNENLPFYGIGVNTLATGNNSVYAGTNYTGIWQRPLSDFGINAVSEPLLLSATSTLITNYPNPFSSTTEIDLSGIVSSGRADISLYIYDMLGK